MESNYVIFNGLVKKQHLVQVSVSDRGIRYGDGLFETLIYDGSSIRFWQHHWERLERGMRILQFNFKDSFDSQSIFEMIYELINISGFTGAQKVRIQVWRSAGGLYEPLNNSILFLIQLFQLPENYNTFNLINVGFSDTISLSGNIISSLKTSNSLLRIVAANERKSRNLDDLILSDVNGFVSEFIAANIFWIKDHIVYTPDLDCGCVSGIMRRNVIDAFQKAGINIQEGKFSIASLKEADFIFSTNIAGIKLVKRIDNKDFESDILTTFKSSQYFSSIQSLI